MNKQRYKLFFNAIKTVEGSQERMAEIWYRAVAQMLIKEYGKGIANERKELLLGGSYR